MIRLERVTKRFPGGQVAVRELTIEFYTGQLTMLVGPPGCGKTTTLKMINRLIEPSDGRIFHDEQDVTHIDPVVLRLRMGYVIQNVGLFPHMSIADNGAAAPRHPPRLASGGAVRGHRPDRARAPAERVPPDSARGPQDGHLRDS